MSVFGAITQEQQQAIAARLLGERQRLGLTQQQMAEAAGIGKRAYCYYESGERLPDAAALLSWDRSGVDLLHLLTGSAADAAPGKATHQDQRLQGQTRRLLLQQARLEGSAGHYRSRTPSAPEGTWLHAAPASVLCIAAAALLLPLGALYACLAVVPAGRSPLTRWLAAIESSQRSLADEVQRRAAPVPPAKR